MCTSKPKVPAPTPVIQRQAYRSPAPREGVEGQDASSRRRRIAGMTTSAQGITDDASTTRRVKMGGDSPMGVSLGGGGSSLTPAPAPTGAAEAARTPPRAVGGGGGAIASAVDPGIMLLGPVGALAYQMKLRQAA